MSKQLSPLLLQNAKCFLLCGVRGEGDLRGERDLRVERDLARAPPAARILF